MVELAGIIILGILCQWIAWKIKIPAILPLILVGLFIGPISTFFTDNSSKLIDGDKIFQGELLFDFISISVALILFEGGLTLKIKEVQELRGTVRNILIVQTFVSLIGGTLATYLILGLDIRIALLFGSLIIVTGPTVIGPILRNVRLNNHVRTVLKWEGILIDPIGALIAILMYEFIVSGLQSNAITAFALKRFFITLSAGILIGTLLAFATYYILKNKQLPKYLMNIGVLGLVVSCFSLSEFIQKESGLLAVTIMGLILANLRLDVLREILAFKEDISVMLVSMLFLILSSRINVKDIDVLGFRSFLIFVIVVFVLRPVTIFLGTMHSNLKVNEKLYLSWICPRGIVAAGVSSIFTIRLSSTHGPVGPIPDAVYLLPLTFLIILGTVIMQGITAKPMAHWLKVQGAKPTGILFMGANEAVRFLAHFLKEEGAQVLVVDIAKSSILEARNMGIPVFTGSLLSEGGLDDIDLTPYGEFFAMTSNPEINMLAIKQLGPEFGNKNLFRLISKNEMENPSLVKTKNLLFSGLVDYIALITLIRSDPVIKRKEFDRAEAFHRFIKENKGSIIPFFIQNKASNFRPVTPQAIFREDQDQWLIYIERSLKKTMRETEL